MQPEEFIQIKSDLSIVKNDILQNRQVQDKLEASINKLSDISNHITKIISIQDQKIENNCDALKKISVILEKRKDEFDLKVSDISKDMVNLEKQLTKELNNQLDTQTDKISQKIDSIKSSIDQSIEDETVELRDSIKKTSDKVDILQKWQWMFLGGGVTVGYLISTFLPNILKFFGKM